MTGNLRDDDLVLVLRAALADSPKRVQRIEHRGEFVWIKRQEILGPIRRLQKGNPGAAFLAEKAALHDWHRMNAPAPRIIAEDADFFATSDSGTSLETLLRDESRSIADRLPPFRAAARALADLHARHLSHGRPSLKDICWDGCRITFLDLERYDVRHNSPSGHARDLVMFVLNGLAVGRGMTPEMDAAVATYRASDPSGIWALAQAWCRRMRWIDLLTRPIQMRGPGKAAEFKAIPLTLATFAAR